MFSETTIQIAATYLTIAQIGFNHVETLIATDRMSVNVQCLAAVPRQLDEFGQAVNLYSLRHREVLISLGSWNQYFLTSPHAAS